MNYCDPYPNPRKPDVVQRALDAIQAALKERQRREGASVEEIAEQMQRKKTYGFNFYTIGPPF